jgi:hypothetical protein
MASLAVLAIMSIGFTMNVGCTSKNPPYGNPLYVQEGDNPFDQPGRFMTALVLEPGGVNVAVGGSQQFKATAYYNDSTSEVVTGAAEWISESPNIGKFTPAGGKFTAQKSGVAIVRARMVIGNNTVTSNAGFVNTFNPSAGIPPAVPLNPYLNSGPEGVRIYWDLNSTDGDLAGYNIYRTQTSSSHYATEYGRLNESPVLYPPFLDNTVVSGWYYYRVTAEDLGGIQGAPSEEISVFITGESHYGGSYDGGSSSIDTEYKDAFETAF